MSSGWMNMEENAKQRQDDARRTKGAELLMCSRPCPCRLLDKAIVRQCLIWCKPLAIPIRNVHFATSVQYWCTLPTDLFRK